MGSAWTNWARRFVLIAVVLVVASVVYLTELRRAETWEVRAAALEAMAFASLGDFPPGTPLDWKEAEARGALLPRWLPDTVKSGEIRVLALPENRFFTEFGRQFFLGQEPRSLVRHHGPGAPGKAGVLRKGTVDINGSPGVTLHLQGGYTRLSWTVGEASLVLFSEEERTDMETLTRVARSIRPQNPSRQNPS